MTHPWLPERATTIQDQVDANREYRAHRETQSPVWVLAALLGAVGAHRAAVGQWYVMPFWLAATIVTALNIKLLVLLVAFILPLADAAVFIVPKIKLRNANLRDEIALEHGVMPYVN